MTRTLICSFGAPRSGYREMTYTEGSATCTSRFVPVAIAQLVGDVERVLIVVTPTVLRRRAEPGLLDDMIAELAPRTTSELSVPEPDAPDSAAETRTRLSRFANFHASVSEGMEHAAKVFAERFPR